MSEWKQYKLGDLIADKSADLQTGPFGTMLNASEYVIEGTPVIAVQDIGENKLVYHKFVFVNAETAQRLSRYRVKENDIIFGRKGAVERRALIKKEEEGWLQGSDCIRLRFSDSVDPKFASYQFGTKYYQEWMFQNAGGATMPSLNQNVLKELPIRFPDITEQHEIASVLSSLDDKIDLLNRQNTTLEALAETLFRQWFVEEANQYTPLGELAKISTGKGLKRNEFIEIGGYPILGANGEIGKTNKYMTEERLILTGRVGTLGEVKISDEKVWISDNVLIIKPNDDKYFYPIYFSIKKFDFENLNAGSTQPLITQTDLKTIGINMSNEINLEKFQEHCENYFQKIKSNQTQIRTLTALRDTLLPKLMSGEVRVEM